MTESAFTYEARGQALVIHLPGELDHHNCRNLRYETDLLLAENYITRLVFDFSKTVFMDSSGIGILLNRYKQMEGKLVPCYDSKEAAIEGGGRQMIPGGKLWEQR